MERGQQHPTTEEWLAQVRLCLDERGFEPVLEEMPAAPVPAIERRAVRAQPGLHEARQRQLAGAQQEMRMVRHQRPGVETGA